MTAKGVSKQRFGKNRIADIPHTIATFLNLKFASLYTGHAIRRTSATEMAKNGTSIEEMKRFVGWRSNTVAESYVARSISTKQTMAERLAPKVSSYFSSKDKAIVDGKIKKVASSKRKLESNSSDDTILTGTTEKTATSKNRTIVIEDDIPAKTQRVDSSSSERTVEHVLDNVSSSGINIAVNNCTIQNFINHHTK